MPTRVATILIAEDNDAVRSWLVTILQAANYTVLTALDGKQALALLVQHAVDLLVLDLHMPILGGYEVMEEIRSSPQLASLPIVVMSGDPRIKAPAANAVLLKPFDYRQVLKTVAELIDKSSRR